MRISDRSSDVCSSDLSSLRRPRRSSLKRLKSESCWKAFVLGAQRVMFAMADLMTRYGSQRVRSADALWTRSRSRSCRRTSDSIRSEEHTSELQSLMRISYAVFCLKKKNKRYNYYIY